MIRDKFNIAIINTKVNRAEDFYRYWPTIKQKPLREWNYKFNDFLTHESVKFDKKFIDNYKFVNRNRLLTTSTTITLPTKINIMVITNSYDVVHSWFVPGIGIKFDCVPGRSTHHHIYFDRPGIYYGQCAEICGRSHHHMPIKILLLKLQQFVLWWYYSLNKNFIELSDKEEVNKTLKASYLFK